MPSSFSFIHVGATLAVALNLICLSRIDGGYYPKICHPERNEMESRDLRTAGR